jgi:hypothetical protein
MRRAFTKLPRYSSQERSFGGGGWIASRIGSVRCTRENR